ncbi:hypothetical protein MXB_2693, partial [Myxobolus squamalis]
MIEISNERILLIKREVLIYKIPPMPTDWKWSEPNFVGCLKVIGSDREIILRIEDQVEGKLFVLSKVPFFPGPSVVPVTDSSRYYVIKVAGTNGGHVDTSYLGSQAFIGLGFTDLCRVLLPQATNLTSVDKDDSWHSLFDSPINGSDLPQPPTKFGVTLARGG